jgi:hypothetical protein
MQRLENIVKKDVEFQICVQKSEEEVEYGSGDTAYTVALVSLFVAASALACVFHKGAVTMGSSKPITTEVSADCFTDLCHLELLQHVFRLV